MSEILAKTFSLGNFLKRRLKDAMSNPGDYAEMTADQNQNEWNRDPNERSMGFFNPVPLGNMSQFARRGIGDVVKEAATNLSRRDFLKKSAGIAGGTAAASIPGAKLLQKFAPEERAAVKQAAVEAAPKYKYNSLKEYLDDVSDYSIDTAHTRSYESAMEHGYSNQPGLERYMDNYVDNFDTKALMKERLLQDELAYKTAKDNLARPNPKKDFKTGLPPQSQVDLLDSFSPQAKKEMKLLKDKSVSLDRTYGGTEPEHEVWTSWLANSKGDIDSTLKALQELP